MLQETSYWRRSQPRVNHLVELALAAAGTSAAPPALSLCMFPPALRSHAYTHMTGLSTASQKIACARAMGLVSLPQDEAMAARTLRYAVPRLASPMSQWGALVEGFAVARRLGRALRLPRYAFHGTERISICQLVDVQRLPPFTNLPRSIDGSDDGASCARGTLSLAEALSSPPKVARLPHAPAGAYLPDGQSAVAVDAHLCIRFDDLAASHTWRTTYPFADGTTYQGHVAAAGDVGEAAEAADADEQYEQLLSRIRVCDQASRKVGQTHACERVADWLPTPSPQHGEKLSAMQSERCPSRLELLWAHGAGGSIAFWDDPSCASGCIIRHCGGTTGIPCCLKRQRALWTGTGGVWQTLAAEVGTFPHWACQGLETFDTQSAGRYTRAVPAPLRRLAQRAEACLRIATEVARAGIEWGLVLAGARAEPPASLIDRLFGPLPPSLANQSGRSSS